jgi:hypothetical protein
MPRSQIASKTRSRGASIEMVSEIGPTEQAILVAGPALYVTAGTNGKYGLSVANPDNH